MSINKIAIVFPVFNGIDFTKRCLDNLTSAISGKDNNNQYHIVLVDDGSRDGTSDWVKEHCKNVNVLSGDGNLWWSGGMNVGMAFAFNELGVNYVVCWNNDIVADMDYFRKLLSKISQYGDGVMLCSKIYFANPANRVFACGCFYNYATGLIRINGHGIVEKESILTEDIKVDWSGGMGTIIPLRIYQAIGGFDAINFPQYKGDADFCLRAGKAGFKIVVCPELKIWNSADNTGLNIRKDGLYYLLTSIRSHFNFKIFMRFVLRHGRPSAWVIAPFFTYIKLCLSVLKRRF